MNIKLSSKKIQLDKAQSSMLVIVTVATVLSVFFLVSAKSLISQAAYQKRLIDARRDAVKQLQENVESANSLIEYYNTVFEGSSPTNLIGGRKDPSPNAAPPNGTNGRIVLNALPSSYDYPALITSISKILRDNGIGSPNISGSDESESISADSQPKPSPQEIELIIGGSGNYSSIQKLVKDVERSIRPFDVTSLQLRGSDTQMFITMNTKTYFQPAKSLNIGNKEIK